MTSFRQNPPPLNSSIKRKKVFGKLVLVGEEGKRKLCHYCGDIMWEAATTRIRGVDPEWVGSLLIILCDHRRRCPTPSSSSSSPFSSPDNGKDPQRVGVVVASPPPLSVSANRGYVDDTRRKCTEKEAMPIKVNIPSFLPSFLLQHQKTNAVKHIYYFPCV